MCLEPASSHREVFFTATSHGNMAEGKNKFPWDFPIRPVIPLRRALGSISNFSVKVFVT
jgi:hypothetical protein